MMEKMVNPPRSPPRPWYWFMRSNQNPSLSELTKRQTGVRSASVT